MNIVATDTSALNAILRSERRRDALKALETAEFIDVHTVQRLRREVFPDGVVERGDAEALFAVERRGLSTCPEWRDFFIETIVDHLVWQCRPSGVLNEEQANWLIAEADQTRTLSAFAILVTILDEAERTPRWFAPTVRGRAMKGWPGLEEAVAA